MSSSPAPKRQRAGDASTAHLPHAAPTPGTAAPGSAADSGLAALLTDVEEETGGTMLLWGVTAAKQTVLVCVADYQPYFFLPCPECVVSQADTQELREPQPPDLQRLVWQLNER